MCGIIGLFYHNSSSHVSQGLVDALTVLQHRGQDAAGIVTISKNRLNLIKDNGTVADVFTQSNVISLQGNVGIGHVRYPTAGGSCSAEAQPFYTNAPFGIALAHNGNLTNTADLRKGLAEELQRRLRNRKLSAEDIFDAVRTVTRRCKGGYAVIMVVNTIGIVAFRDPNGIRPLCFGSRRHTTQNRIPGNDYAIASESVAIDILGPDWRFDRDIKPGEAIFISTETGHLYTEIIHSNPVLNPCLFEYVYFARPDSIIDGVSVYEARINMGSSLAKKILHNYTHLDIDVVIPIPETSRTAALQCATTLQKPYREGFVKNRYIARTFIMPGQEMRRKTVRLKLNTICSEFKNKNVLLIDDSIVRGTTSFELIQMARDAGAKHVYFASAAPPVKFPNVYGIDIPTKSELIACTEPNDIAIARALNADEVIYNDLPDVIQSVTSLNPVMKTLDASCFDGIYVTGDITHDYLDALERGRGKGRKGAQTEEKSAPMMVSTTSTVATSTSNSTTSSAHSNSPPTSPRLSPLPKSTIHITSSSTTTSSIPLVDLMDVHGDGSESPQPVDSPVSSVPSSPLLNNQANSISSNSLGSFDSGTTPVNKNACEGIHNGGPHKKNAYGSELASNPKKARLV